MLMILRSYNPYIIAILANGFVFGFNPEINSFGDMVIR